MVSVNDVRGHARYERKSVVFITLEVNNGSCLHDKYYWDSMPWIPTYDCQNPEEISAIG